MRLLPFNLHFTGEEIRAKEAKSIAEGHTGSAELTFRLPALHHCVTLLPRPEEWASHRFLREHGEVWEDSVRSHPPGAGGPGNLGPGGPRSRIRK